MVYFCYIIYNNNLSYVGITNNLSRRIKQHNKLLKGGAKYTTRNDSNWAYGCYISGFKTKQDALRFEWALKHIPPKNKGGIENRIKKLLILLNKKKWTKSSPNSKNYKLEINWCDIFLIPEDLNLKLPEYISNNFVYL